MYTCSSAPMSMGIEAAHQDIVPFRRKQSGMPSPVAQQMRGVMKAVVLLKSCKWVGGPGAEVQTLRRRWCCESGMLLVSSTTSLGPV